MVGTALKRTAINTAEAVAASTAAAAKAAELVGAVEDTANQSLRVINAAQETAKITLQGSQNVITGATDLTTGGLNATADQLGAVNKLSKEGLQAATGAIAILNEAISQNGGLIVKIIGAPLKVVETTAEGINTMLTILLASPLRSIKELLDRRKVMNELQWKAKLEQFELKTGFAAERAKYELQQQHNKEMENLKALGRLADEAEKTQEAVKNQVVETAKEVTDPATAAAIAKAANDNQKGAGKINKRIIRGGEDDQGGADPAVLTAIEAAVTEDPAGLVQKIETAESQVSSTGGRKRTRRNKRRNTKGKNRKTRTFHREPRIFP